MKAPVFVVGCPRSGTTLLYSMLVAAGGFAAYRKETFFYDLAPRFPSLAASAARREFISRFLGGYLGRVPGFDVQPLARRALEKCRHTHEFLPLLMREIAAVQHVDRWIEATPAHVSYLREIVRAVPDALVVHVIRDGRDCAISTAVQGWVAALPWDRSRKLGVAALFWEWMVRQGRAFGRRHADRYYELRFEELIADPPAVLRRLGRFLDHELDYDRIRQNPVHAMKIPNTSFRTERKRADFNPVGRWKDKCRPEDVRLCEALVGPWLAELGYELAYPPVARRPPRAGLMRLTYLPYFHSRHWLKTRTPLGRWMTSTRAWAQQPRPGEDPVWPPAAGRFATTDSYGAAAR